MPSDSSRAKAGIGLTTAAWFGVLFLNVPILFIILYCFTTDDRSYSFPPPGLTTHWFGVAFARDDLWAALGLSLRVALVAMCVALVLGSMGMNFGSGMTGGLAYVLRAGAEEVIHSDFVNLAEVTEQEEVWLRRVLEQHAFLTDSASAARLLARRDALPLLRVQPIHFQGTIEETWRPHLLALQNSTLLLATAHEMHASTASMHA